MCGLYMHASGEWSQTINLYIWYDLLENHELLIGPLRSVSLIGYSSCLRNSVRGVGRLVFSLYNIETSPTIKLYLLPAFIINTGKSDPNLIGTCNASSNENCLFLIMNILCESFMTELSEVHDVVIVHVGVLIGLRSRYPNDSRHVATQCHSVHSSSYLWPSNSSHLS